MILGTFAVLYVLGFSINTLTLFALVLAIGLLVDDAIVVVENVERLMHEQHLTPKEAAIESMGEISGALVGITLVLTAVLFQCLFRWFNWRDLPSVFHYFSCRYGIIAYGCTHFNACIVCINFKT